MSDLIDMLSEVGELRRLGWNPQFTVVAFRRVENECYPGCDGLQPCACQSRYTGYAARTGYHVRCSDHRNCEVFLTAFRTHHFNRDFFYRIRDRGGVVENDPRE